MYLGTLKAKYYPCMNKAGKVFRRCYVCGRIMDIDKFCKNKSKPLGHEYRCKECNNKNRHKIKKEMTQKTKHNAKKKMARRMLTRTERSTGASLFQSEGWKKRAAAREKKQSKQLKKK